MPHGRLRLRGFRLPAGVAAAALLAPRTTAKKKGTGAKASPCVRVVQDSEEGHQMKEAGAVQIGSHS
jgi:hypothetical protein